MTTLKKILTLLLVISMLASVFALTSCGGKNKGDNNENNENNETNNGGNEGATTDKTYTVTFVDGDNNPVEGVKVIITDGKSYLTKTSDADGKASVQLPEASVSVTVVSVPEGYEKPAKATFANGTTDLTVTLTKVASNKVTYTVKVVDQNGDAVVGMGVQLCPGGVCLADNFVTDENGEVSVEITPKDYVSVQLKELDGYTLPAPTDGSYHGTIGSGETEITLVVTKN